MNIENLKDYLVDGYWLVNSKGVIIDVNNAYCNMSGYTKDEIIGKAVQKLEIMDNEEQVKTRMEKLKEQSYDNFESKHLKKDSNYFYCDVSINTLKNYDEIYFVCIIRDITEKKKGEEELKRFKNIVDNMNLGFHLYQMENIDEDTSLRMKYVNDASEVFTGIKKEDLIGKTLDENFPGLRQINIPQIYSEVVRKGKKISFENIVYSDERIPISSFYVKAFPLENNYIGVIFENISDKKKIEAEFLKSKEMTEKREKLLNITGEIANVGGWEINLKLNTLTWTKEVYKIHEIDEKFLPTIETGVNFYTDSSIPIIQKALNDSISYGIPFDVELKIKTAKQNIRDVRAVGYVKKDENNVPEYVYGVFQDITKNKQVEKELIVAKEEAEKANKAKTEFLSNMSHEIRTPMNAILGFTDILLESGYDDEKTEMLETIKEASENLLNIINNILSLSKIEAGMYKTEKEKINLLEKMTSIIKLYEKQAKLKEIDFRVNIQREADEEIMVDYLSIAKITNNLLSNALKFTNKGFIAFNLKILENNWIEIIIEDTGIGINEKKQNNLFEPFEQGEHYLTKQYEGSGLGFAIVKKLIDLLKGNIKVETEIGKGTKVSFTIPFENAKLKLMPEREDITNELRFKDLRIISAEDLELNQKLLEMYFKNKCTIFKKVYNGVELLEEIEKERYDLILMDIQMPVMNGIEATKIIKRNSKYRDIPIIAVSAYALEENIEEMYKSGVDEVIAKPIQKEELINKISKVLEKT